MGKTDEEIIRVLDYVGSTMGGLWEELRYGQVDMRNAMKVAADGMGAIANELHVLNEQIKAAPILRAMVQTSPIIRQGGKG